MHNESPAKAVVTFWTIRELNQSEYLSVNLGRGNKAAVYFTSEERASSFRRADFVEMNSKAVEMAANAFVEWLTKRTESRTHFIYRNPSNRFCLGKPVRILELLREVQEAHSNDLTSRPSQRTNSPTSNIRSTATARRPS